MMDINNNINTLAKLCWAKLNPYKSLFNHMYETGMIAKTFLQSSKYCALLPIIEECIVQEIKEEQLISTISFIVALHDIGKAFPNFQKKALDKEPVEWQVQKEFELIKKYSMFHNEFTTSENFRHEIASEIVSERLFKENEMGPNIKRSIKAIYRNHHLVEEKIGIDKTNDEYNFAKPELWNEVQDILFNRLKKEFNPELNVEVKDCKKSIFTTLLLGFLYRCDWISSSIFTHNEFDSFEEYKEYVICTCENYIKTMHIEKIEIFENKLSIKDIFHELRQYPLRPLQSKAEELKNIDFDCVLIEDLTGSGKTEAGFYLAYQAMCRRKKQGIFFGLPTNATEETMNPRIQMAIDSIFGKKAHSVSHATGTSWIKEALNCEQSEIKERMGSSKETKLMFPFSTGTVDQIMKGTLKQKYALIPLMELATKVVIIDEMHAYDAYMRGILGVTLSWLKEFHVPVIIMSATLPNIIKEEIHKVYSEEKFSPRNEYPLLSIYGSEGVKECPVETTTSKQYKVNVATIGNIPFENYACCTAKKMVKNGGNLCIICNTVSTAKVTYEKVLNIFPDVESHLFHGQTTLKEKHDMTELLVSKYGKDRSNRPIRSIVVATQIVEQSIDVDFDYMITELAPIDLLVQRFGRWHRHSDAGTIRETVNSDVPIQVVAYANLKQHYVYANCITLLQRTKQYLENNKVLVVPKHSREMIEYVYDIKEYSENELTRLENQQGIADWNTIRLAEQSRTIPYKKEEIVHISQLPTRDSEGDYKVELCVLTKEIYDEVKNKKPSKKLCAKIMYEYTIPVKKKFIEQISEDSKFEGSYWLEECVICTEEAYNTALEKSISLKN